MLHILSMYVIISCVLCIIVVSFSGYEAQSKIAWGHAIFMSLFMPIIILVMIIKWIFSKLKK